MTAIANVQYPELESLFEVNVTKDTFKFNAAHFVAYPGFRERLHGHNYRVAVRLLGSRKIGPDGYVIDFGCVKDVVKRICKDINEHFLCPTLSNVMTVSTVALGESGEESVRLDCEDGSLFIFPRSDCAMLPIVHATTEELAIYLWGKILEGLDADHLLKRGIHTMEVNVSEAPGQDATFRLRIPQAKDGDSSHLFDVASYVTKGEVVPRPCLPTGSKNPQSVHSGTNCGPDCESCGVKLSSKLSAIADMINSGKVGGDGTNLTGKDLEAMLSDPS